MDTLVLIQQRWRVDVSPSDWVKLARLGPSRRPRDIKQLFFRDQKDSQAPSRARGFLGDLNDDEYQEMYDMVREDLTVDFPDVHALLKTSKQDGKTMSVIMTHVGQWLNQTPFLATARGGNKPQLRDDLLPALRLRYGDHAEAKSIDLQEQVLGFVREHLQSFTDPSITHLLEQLPLDHPTDYRERFHHDPWRGLLNVVYQMCGPHFAGTAMLCFNRQDPSTLASGQTSTLASGLCHALSRMPEVSQNPALQGKAAEDTLCDLIQPVVLRWATERCRDAIANPESSWAESTLQRLRDDLERYQALARTDPSSSQDGARGSRAESTMIARVEVDESSRMPTPRGPSRSPPPTFSSGAKSTEGDGNQLAKKTARRSGFNLPWNTSDGIGDSSPGPISLQSPPPAKLPGILSTGNNARRLPPVGGGGGKGWRARPSTQRSHR